MTTAMNQIKNHFERYKGNDMTRTEALQVAKTALRLNGMNRERSDCINALVKLQDDGVLTQIVIGSRGGRGYRVN